MVHAQESRRELTQACIKGPDDDGLDGLDDLIRGHTAQKHEEKKRIEVIAEEKFKELWGKYVTALNLVDTLKIDLIEEYLGGVVTEVLTPQEIEEFFRLTIAYEESKYYQKSTAKIINKLIKNSYNAGHSEFVLDTRHLSRQIDGLFERIIGARERAIHLTINGNLNNYRGDGSRKYSFVYVTINGNVNDYGGCPHGSNLTINGNANRIYYPGRGTCIKINGNLGFYNCNVSDYSSLIVTGEIRNFEVDVYSKECTFKTSNSKTLDVFLRHTPLFKGHKVYFINEDGTETKIGAWEWFVKRMEYKIKDE